MFCRYFTHTVGCPSYQFFFFHGSLFTFMCVCVCKCLCIFISKIHCQTWGHLDYFLLSSNSFCSSSLYINDTFWGNFCEKYQVCIYNLLFLFVCMSCLFAYSYSILPALFVEGTLLFPLNCLCFLVFFPQCYHVLITAALW